MFFSRIDFQEREEWSTKEKKHMKYLWRPSSKHFGDQY